jgi:hypothetical protein
MDERMSPEVRREIIMEMVWELAESLEPQDGTWLSLDAQNRVVEIDRVLTSALGLYETSRDPTAADQRSD